MRLTFVRRAPIFAIANSKCPRKRGWCGCGFCGMWLRRVRLVRVLIVGRCLRLLVWGLVLLLLMRGRLMRGRLRWGLGGRRFRGRR
jgi:hypothetical protein